MPGTSDDGNPATERQPLLAGTGSGDEGLQNGVGIVNARRARQDGDAEERVIGSGGGRFTRNLGALEAFAIVISIVIGSGVFTSPGSIDTNVPSPGVALLTWLVGGVLAWTGASTMAELGTAIPGEGV